MNLGNTLKEGWTSLSPLINQGLSLNPSIVAFCLSRAVTEDHPELGYSFDNRLGHTSGNVSTLTIYKRGLIPKAVFICLISDQSVSTECLEDVLINLSEVKKLGHVPVLQKAKTGGNYLEQVIPLDTSCKFGLFQLPHSDKAFNIPETLSRFIDGRLASRTHIATLQLEYPDKNCTSGREAISPSFSRADECFYPNFEFELDSGRVVRVHGLIWEPTYDEVIRKGTGQEVVVTRKRLRARELFGGERSFHFIEKDFGKSGTRRLQNSCFFVWLSSAPFDSQALYSELIVMFFHELEPGSTVEQAIQSALSDLDWDEYATDIDEHYLTIWNATEDNGTRH